MDFPITDVMQMMGRAGRPQFDTEAVAVVFVHDVKKHFYKKFMFEPFPVESSAYPALPLGYRTRLCPLVTVPCAQLRSLVAVNRTRGIVVERAGGAPAGRPAQAAPSPIAPARRWMAPVLLC